MTNDNKNDHWNVSLTSIKWTSSMSYIAITHKVSLLIIVMLNTLKIERVHLSGQPDFSNFPVLGIFFFFFLQIW